MNALERDLIRWENGEMTLEQVERAHPEAGVRELMRLHTRLSMLRAIPLPDVEKAWSMTLPMLDRGMTSEPVRSPARSSRLRDWARRPLAASFAAVVMSGGAAYAAGFEPVQRAVDRVWDRAQEVTGLEGSDEEESTSVVPVGDGAEGSSRGDDASAPGRERADEVRGQGKEKGPNHGQRVFGHSHKKDNDASGTDHVPGSPPAHARNDEAKKPDKDKEKNNNGSGAPEAPGNSGNNGGGNGPPDAPGNSGNSGNNGGGNGNGGGGNPVEEPEETIDSAGGGPPAPEDDPPGASGEDHGNGNGKDKDK